MWSGRCDTIKYACRTPQFKRGSRGRCHQSVSNHKGIDSSSPANFAFTGFSTCHSLNNILGAEKSQVFSWN